MAAGRADTRHCCVPFCSSDGRYSENISFHKLPKNDTLRKQWMDKIRRDEGPLFRINSSTCVCSNHFKPDDFKWTPVKKTLKKGSVPSVFNWVEPKSLRRVTGRKPTAAYRGPTLKRETLSLVSDIDSNIEELMDTDECLLQQELNMKLAELKAKTEECANL